MEYIARYFDKGSQTVEEHLKETSNLSGLFAGKIGLSSLGKLEGLLHDFGKYSDNFQNYIRSVSGKSEPDFESDNNAGRGKVDHSTAGAQIIWEALNNKSPISKFTAQVLALCIASHHSGLIDCLSPDGEDKFSIRMVKNSADTHIDQVQIQADVQILTNVESYLNSPECSDSLETVLKQLLTDEPSKTIREFYVGLIIRFLFSALIDADRLSSAQRKIENKPRWATLVKRLEYHISKLKRDNWVDDVRSEVSQACKEFAVREKGLYRLTVPTGGGKTLSSLRFALNHAAHHHMERIIYVIPYTSIIDQNAAIARLILETKHRTNKITVLEHHSNLTPGKETPQSVLLSENWDAPIIFTTTVQFLEALFSGGTRGARRMHQLANAVIIFDEIQTLPVKTVHIFNNAINFLVKQCGSTAVFCTATQPLLDAVDPQKGSARMSHNPEMAPRPIQLFQSLRRVEIIDKRKSGGWTDSEIAQYICEQAKETGSTLTIVNTKASAQTLYTLCNKQKYKVYHLSTNMCPAHRIKVINNIKKQLESRKPRSKPIICISTQLIEAGVDIDFGSVVRYLAGLNSIAQAAGRCNRNGKRPSGKVTIVNPSCESLSRLPEIQFGKEIAERVLHEYYDNPDVFGHDLLSPNAMRQYYKYYFFDRTNDMSYKISSHEIGHDDDLLSLLSTNSLSVAAYNRSNKSAPPLQIRQSFKSGTGCFRVIDAPGDGVIIPYDKGKKIISKLSATDNPEEIRKLLRDAQRYSVNLYPQVLGNLSETGCVYETRKDSGIFYLDVRYYDNHIGITSQQSKMIDFLNG